MARVPPGTGGGEGIAYGRKGKGLLIHSLTDAAGMPLSACTTPANGDERARVLPRLDAVHVRTGRQGRPRKRLRILAADKGYDATDLRRRLRARGIRPQIPTRVWKGHKLRGRPIKNAIPRYQAERTFAWCQRKYRRLVVRWERLAACFNAFLALAMVQMWVHKITVG
jgi:IS5 family transposase